MKISNVSYYQLTLMLHVLKKDIVIELEWEVEKLKLRYMKRVAITAVIALIVSNWLPLAPLGNQTAHADPSQVSCGNRVALINGSFEEPDLLNLPSNALHKNGGSWYTIYDDFVPGWQTTDSTGTIEFSSPTKLGVDPYDWSKYHYVTDVPDGEQYVELNAYNFGQLYQDVQTTPGQTINWRLSHRAAYQIQTPGYDKMAVRIGSSSTDPSQLPVVEEIKTHTSQGWVEYRGTYTVPAGQTLTRFGFEAVESVLGYTDNGNFLDDIFLGTEPCITSTKTVDPPGEIGVGTELTYAINVKNEGGDIAAKMNVADSIPAGTEYVPGSMVLMNGSTSKKLTDGIDADEGQFDGSKIIIRIGDLPNTTQLPNGVTVQFKVKVLSDYAVKSIRNKAQVEYDNLLTGEHVQKETNETASPIILPKLESSKTMTIQEKATGNLDTQHVEVGDTLLYTIQTRNTNANTMVKNLTISDVLPAELEYVPGSIKVDGVSVTDSEGDDNGHYALGQVVGEFGDVSDTALHTVQFEAVVQPGQAGKDIINIASVKGDNVDKSDNPREVVQVYPRNPQIESEKFAVNTVSKATYEVGDTITYTIRTKAVVNDKALEDLTITDTLPVGLEYVPRSLRVDGVSVTDEKDGDAGYSVTGVVYGSFGNVQDTNWHTLEFQAIIQSGQGGQVIQNTALVTAGNLDQPGTPTEKFVVEPEPPVEPPVEPPIDPKPPVNPPVNPVDPPVTPPVDPGNGGGDGSGNVPPHSPVVESEKVARDLNGGNVEVGDTIEYTIRARNTVSGSQVTNLVISDELPKELEYVVGTLKVNGIPVTDSDDGDKGEYANGTVKGSFGTVMDTAWHTLVFQAKIIKGEHGDIIKNVGVVSGSNLNVPSRPSEEITINDPTSTDSAPVLESGKEVKDLNGGTIQVGDVVEYTIRTRNTTPNAVKNLKISDELPNELKYVAGSLKVNGQSVTDAQDTDKGSYFNSIVSGQFGDITDTAWHTIVFRAEVIAGQVGQTIRNVGEITGDNLVIPENPYEDIIIGGGKGSNPGIPGDPIDESSTDKPSSPGSGDADSKSPDSNQSGGSSGSIDSESRTRVLTKTEQDKQQLNKLPNTSANFYNLGLVGVAALIAGLILMRRKNKA